MEPTYVVYPKRPIDGRRWTYGGACSTAIEGDRYEKSTSGFEHDIELAGACLEWWRMRGFKGAPSSPAQCWHREAARLGLARPSVPWSANVILRGHHHGGWQEALSVGAVPGPVCMVDMRSAYQWAGSLPLPVGLEPARPGSERFVGIMDVESHSEPMVPRYFEPGRRIVTHEDVEAYGLDGKIVAALTWTREDDRGARVWDSLEDMPHRARKIASRSYWGLWAQSDGATCEIWRAGRCVKSWTLPAMRTDFAAATIIVHRVIRRVWRLARESGHVVLTDAVVTSGGVTLGDDPGDWRLVDVYPGGIFVIAPGLWDVLPVGANLADWVKRSGIMRGSDAWLDPATVQRLRDAGVLDEPAWRAIFRERMKRPETVSLARSGRVDDILTGRRSA